jgi:hypothetical protein
MSIAKGKERAANPTGNIMTAAIITVLAKDTFFRITEPDTFSSDRKKFKAYESQYRMYI